MTIARDVLVKIEVLDLGPENDKLEIATDYCLTRNWKSTGLLGEARNIHSEVLEMRDANHMDWQSMKLNTREREAEQQQEDLP
jgi:hypothetical protein